MALPFLKVLNERHQREKVLIVSTLAQKGGAETIRALELGAFDFITKPTSLSEAKGPFFINMFIRMLYVATGLSTAGLDTGEEQSVPKPETQKTVFKKLFHIQKAPVMQRKRGGVAGEVKADRSKHSKEPLVLGANKIVARKHCNRSFQNCRRISMRQLSLYSICRKDLPDRLQDV